MSVINWSNVKLYINSAEFLGVQSVNYKPEAENTFSNNGYNWSVVMYKDPWAALLNAATRHESAKKTINVTKRLKRVYEIVLRKSNLN